jgi:hypothetical protein
MIKCFQDFFGILGNLLNVNGKRNKNAIEILNAPTSSAENTSSPLLIKMKELPQTSTRDKRIIHAIDML